jgi:transcriptional regulator with XRE-family HTH domain
MGKSKASDRDPVLVTFGLAIQQRKRALKLSQEEAAAQTGLSRTYYADIERGSRNIGLRNVVKISSARKASVFGMGFGLQVTCVPVLSNLPPNSVTCA